MEVSPQERMRATNPQPAPKPQRTTCKRQGCASYGGREGNNPPTTEIGGKGVDLGRAGHSQVYPPPSTSNPEGISAFLSLLSNIQNPPRNTTNAAVVDGRIPRRKQQSVELEEARQRELKRCTERRWEAHDNQPKIRRTREADATRNRRPSEETEMRQRGIGDVPSDDGRQSNNQPKIRKIRNLVETRAKLIIAATNRRAEGTSGGRSGNRREGLSADEVPNLNQH